MKKKGEGYCVKYFHDGKHVGYRKPLEEGDVNVGGHCAISDVPVAMSREEAERIVENFPRIDGSNGRVLARMEDAE
jgi:hypothetical protein